jgi:hypothetical protein
VTAATSDRSRSSRSSRRSACRTTSSCAATTTPSIGTAASFIGEADVIVEGNQEIRVGVFQADDPVDFRAAGLELVTIGGNMPDTIRFEATTSP